MQLTMNEINLVQERGGELLVSSVVIAENIDLLHDSILSTIEKY
jgi:phage regulator Rha-like protein